MERLPVPVLFWLARRPTEAALAGFVPVAYFGAITAAFFGEARFNLPLLPLYPVIAVCILTAFFNAPGGLSCATGGEHDRVADR